MKQAKSALRIKSVHRRLGCGACLVVGAATLLLIGARPGPAWAEPLAVPPASTSWERFDPTLELPRIYNPDGSLPPDAEMPGAVMMPEASPETGVPPSASAPPPSVPVITHGDPPTGDGHDADAASPAVNDNDESADGGGSLPEPDPESALSAPSMLDPSEGIDGQGGLNRAAQDNSPLTDPDGNPVGNAQDYQNEQVDAPSVVLIPPPYYGPRQPLYGYPSYGVPLGRYPSVGRASSRMLPQPIPPNVGFGAMPPPGYPWIGGSPMVPWSATHPISPPSSLLLRSFPTR